jgi:hypothetical protein
MTAGVWHVWSISKLIDAALGRCATQAHSYCAGTPQAVPGNRGRTGLIRHGMSCLTHFGNRDKSPPTVLISLCGTVAERYIPARECYDAGCTPAPLHVFSMPRRQFASEKSLQNHAGLTGDFYAFEGAATFAKWRALLSPDKYEIVDVRTSQGIRRAMLFPKRILLAEWELDAPLRKALGIKRPDENK